MINKSNRKGFTMIELLGVIVVLGVLSVVAIASVTRLINRAHKESDEQYARTLKQAAQSYMQSNTDKLPRDIGGKTRVYAQTLRDKNYIKDDIKNSSGDDCMTNSFVMVRKVSKTKYEYESIILCGDDEYTEADAVTPIIQVHFSDDANSSSFDVMNNVNKAVIYMELSGGEKDGEKIAIEGYSYIISAETTENKYMQEVYNSGTLSGNGYNEISVARKLSDYMDVAHVTNFSVEVTVINVEGGTSTRTFDASNTASTYQDTIPPTCKGVDGAASGANDWIGIGNATRIVTVTCDDGKGSGCLRPTFARSWPNDDQEDAEWAYIQVSDNARNSNLASTSSEITGNSLCDIEVNNSNPCRVRVNVDKNRPTIKVLGAYRADANGNIADTDNDGDVSDEPSTYTAGMEVKDNAERGTLSYNAYNNLVSDWMNNNRYPNGVVYKIQISDSLHLASWSWETNGSYITSTAPGSGYTTYTTSNKDEVKSETIAAPENSNCGVLTKTIYVHFKDEGRRKGRLTVKDAANNTTELFIEANIDKSAPPLPSDISYTYVDDGTKNYVPGTTHWINKTVTAKVNDDYKRDNTSGPSKVTLSDWDKFVYHVVQEYNSNKDEYGDVGKVEFNATYEGKNKVEFKNCDKAGNCTAYTGLKPIWVDFTKPVCKISKLARKTSSSSWSNYTDLQSSYGWLGINEIARVQADCQEEGTTDSSGNYDTDGSTKASGCLKDLPTWKLTFYHDYEVNINTDNAGAVGNNSGGKVRDKAGNVTDCSKANAVRIDHNSPTCTITGESTSWRKSGTTVKKTCNDTGGSGCVNGIISSVAYTADEHTYKVMTQKNSYTVIDKADNSPAGADVAECSRTSMNVYVDKQKPTCSGAKSNLNETSGVTIKYTCGDNGGSGVKNCPGGSDHKETGVKDTVKYTVYDNVNNYMTCTVKVTAYKQYKYILKNVMKTCSIGSCCGYIKKTSGTCCGWNKHTGQNCRNCGSVPTKYQDVGSSGKCPSGYSNIGCIQMSHDYCQKYRCKKPGYCKTCTWNTTAKSCANPCTGPQTCTKSCCGYKCGSDWSGWGHASTGCTSKSRTLYK